MSTRSALRVLPWVLTVVCFIAVLLLSAMVLFPKANFFGVESRARNAEVVSSVTDVQEVALLAVGIEGIEERNSSGTFSLPLAGDDATLPGSGRAKFVKYDLTAKLGLDGSAVQIHETGKNAFHITIPEFKVIGSEEPHFEVIVEDNGVLSWLTPEIEDFEISNEIQSDESLDKYLDDYEEMLRDQAEAFYGGIVKGVVPDATVEYEYQR